VKHVPSNPELEVAVGLAGLRMPLTPREVQASQLDLVTSVGQAAIDIMRGDHDAGQAAFQKVFDRFPDTPNVHYVYGCLLFTGHYDQAVAQLQQEVAVSPQSATAHAMLAWVKEYDEDFEGALPDAEKAAAEDPSLPLGQLVYARALVGTGDVAKGLPHIQQVLLEQPDNLEAHMTLAMAYSKLGRSADSWKERMLCLQLSQQSAAARGASANP
jgi:predicted Zn-dependent protease